MLILAIFNQLMLLEHAGQECRSGILTLTLAISLLTRFSARCLFEMRLGRLDLILAPDGSLVYSTVGLATRVCRLLSDNLNLIRQVLLLRANSFFIDCPAVFIIIDGVQRVLS